MRDWLAALDPKTGDVKWKTYSVPAPGEPGSETWKDKNNAWQTGGGAFYGTGSYDPANNLTYWGSGNPVPAYDLELSARRQSLHVERASPSTPRAARSRGTTNTRRTTTATMTRPAAHIIIDTKVNGEDRKILVACRPQRLQLHASIASTASSSRPTQHVKELTWTKGIDPKTGKPLDYDPEQRHPALCRDRRGAARTR